MVSNYSGSVDWHPLAILNWHVEKPALSRRIAELQIPGLKNKKWRWNWLTFIVAPKSVNSATFYH